MNFASDNWAGASDQVAAAVEAARHGLAPAYGRDEWSARATARLAEVFEHPVEVAFVATGTAANALSLAALSPPWGAVVCHEAAHIAMDECGAPEFYGGIKLLGLAGARGKLTPEAVADAFARFPARQPQAIRPAVVSLTQATEAGTVYTPDEVSAIAAVAASRDVAVHMDGARFANAIASLGCAPADLTWRAGVDVLSLGGTKNGCFLAEAIVVFSPQKAATLLHRQKRAGHVVSKNRFVAAQIEAWLSPGADGAPHWIELARSANRAAQRLAAGLAASGVGRPAWPPQANEVFAILTRDAAARARAAGAQFYEWGAWSAAPEHRPLDGEVLVRLVASFATTDAEVDAFLETVRAT